MQTGSGLLGHDDGDVSDDEKSVVAGLQRIYTEEVSTSSQAHERMRLKQM